MKEFQLSVLPKSGKFDAAPVQPKIKVIGIGGGGGNAVGTMIESGLAGVEFIVANTDAQALEQIDGAVPVQLGAGMTEGLGAGADPTLGRAAAESALGDVLDAVGMPHMVFVTAGMGGGTGTGAAPVIARAVRDLGVLTVAVVTTPFDFEGTERRRVAAAGVARLRGSVDTMLVVPNQNLLRVASADTTFAQALRIADSVLYSAVRGVTDLVVQPGLINLDFADIKTVMTDMGRALMSVGEATGEDRAVRAAEIAMRNPLMDDLSTEGARGLLINVTGGDDLTLHEVDTAVQHVRADAHDDANVIFGAVMDPQAEGTVRVAIVATGLADPADPPRPTGTKPDEKADGRGETAETAPGGSRDAPETLSESAGSSPNVARLYPAAGATDPTTAGRQSPTPAATVGEPLDRRWPDRLFRRERLPWLQPLPRTLGTT